MYTCTNVCWCSTRLTAINRLEVFEYVAHAHALARITDDHAANQLLQQLHLLAVTRVAGDDVGLRLSFHRCLIHLLTNRYQFVRFQRGVFTQQKQQTDVG